MIVGLWEKKELNTTLGEFPFILCKLYLTFHVEKVPDYLIITKSMVLIKTGIFQLARATELPIALIGVEL